MDIHDFHIKGFTFSALLPAFELPRPLFEQLTDNENDLINIFGEYYVQWDEGYPLVALDYCDAHNNDNSVACNSYVCDYFKDMVQEHILNTWDVEERAMEYEAMKYEYETTVDDIFKGEK
jgi:hypothetical protein